MTTKLKAPARTKRAGLEQLKATARELLTQEIRFIYSTEFEKLRNVSRPIDEAEALLVRLQANVVEGSEDAVIPNEMDLSETILLRNWSSPDRLLTFEEEQILFKAMNLLRYRINQSRSRLDEEKPRAETIRQIQQMLDLVQRIRSQLVKSNLRLVSSIARKFSTSETDVDDFSSDGCMILLGAIDRFDYSRQFRFSTYATHSIQRHFFRAWKVRQKRKERFPNAVPELLNEVPQSQGEEPICSNPAVIVADLLSRADQLLDEREHKILVNRFGLGVEQSARTLREIAADLGISKERVRQLQMKALSKLKDLIDPERVNLDSLLAAC